MIDFKKQLETAELANKDYMDVVKQISIAKVVRDSIFTVSYENLIKRKLTNDEFNKLCKYIYLFPSNMSIETTVDYVMRSFIVNDEYEEVQTINDTVFKLTDLDDKDKRQEIFDFTNDYISENVAVESMMFYDFFKEFDKLS